MTFRIEFTKSAAKSLKTVPKAARKRIAEKIESVAEAPPEPATTNSARVSFHASCYSVEYLNLEIERRYGPVAVPGIPLPTPA